jgi:hypothetical protein
MRHAEFSLRNLDVGYKLSKLVRGAEGDRIVVGFKRSSKGDFLVQYEAFQCGVAGCWVCGH